MAALVGGGKEMASAAEWFAAAANGEVPNTNQTSMRRDHRTWTGEAAAPAWPWPGLLGQAGPWPPRGGT